MARKAKKSVNKQRRSLITLMAPKSPISEQYRTIRTNIQFSTVDEAIRSIVVTSTAPGEGKSTTVSNLAVVFAQQGKKVLLIDADLRKPTTHYTFQIMNTKGLTNVLTKQIHFHEAVQETVMENLNILTSGPIPPNPSELLASNAMKQLLEEAYKLYDLVLFDAPPILAVTDAQVLANLSDGSIMVTSSGFTDKDAAVKAKELLENAKSKLLGAILNNKQVNEKSYYYYYSYK
ncbi:CpsD/CapB family tyrosine-protein kinase [Pallidibacillus thermolactis]|jgi:protein-tyrosine kinase|uniref:CpsD/CapB family tyrosine-protein kinase n=1 Tax=Pallidibacillus thermolactis TaxID=251051 RepID=UPI0021DB6880|nr:CpsD/CapB family tyrosine-protein kinase [Pallidibacillus thermolactis]MCU9599717.1 CpsD/CapB family tyrosine-protein kinase [Pallidibacillus thermolactis subsp. kokeshiiformis]